MVKVRVKVRFRVQKYLDFDPWRHSEPFIWETYQKDQLERTSIFRVGCKNHYWVSFGDKITFFQCLRLSNQLVIWFAWNITIYWILLNCKHPILSLFTISIISWLSSKINDTARQSVRNAWIRPIKRFTFSAYVQNFTLIYQGRVLTFNQLKGSKKNPSNIFWAFKVL